MIPQKLPGALALGLLASLAAHAALFGGEHTVGGSYHGMLVQVALTVVLGFGALLGALAWAQSGNSSDGSVLAVRLRERLPGFLGIIVSTAMWYVAIEAIEPHHAAAPAIALIAALAAVSYVVLRLARAIADTFARVVIAIFRSPFSPRTPAWQRRPRVRPIARLTIPTRRRFARPPPVAFALIRA